MQDVSGLLQTLNSLVSLLSTENEERYLPSILEGMALIGGAFDADRVQIWQNELVDGKLHFVHKFQWLSGFGENKKPVPIGLKFPYSIMPEWEKSFLSGGRINMPLSRMSEDEQVFLNAYEIKTIVITPLFLKDKFWGFFSIDDCREERVFSDEEISILHSGGLLIANALLHDEKARDFSNVASRLKAVVANYPGVICAADKDLNITLFDGLLLPSLLDNAWFYEGQTIEGALQREEYKHILGRVFDTFTKGVQDWNFEINDKVFHMITTPISDDAGQVSGVVGRIDDVTKVTRLQEELKEALEKAEAAVHAHESAQHTVSAMFESNPHINILFDSNLKVIDCNPAAVRFMGFETKEEMLAGFAGRIAKTIPPILSTGRKTRPIIEIFKDAIKDGYIHLETEFILVAGRRTVDIELKRIPYENSYAIVGYIYDMTEIRDRETELVRRSQQLSEAVEEAKAANQAKSIFLSNMSHEIRTPMNAILGITEIQLQNDALTSTAREALEKIYNSSDLLLGIINDILDFSKIEAGKLELVSANYEIASLISDTAQINMMRIGSKIIEFELSVDENSPKSLSGDELRIKQILNNILSNAFKYTNEGLVKLSVAPEAGIDMAAVAEGSEVTLVFSVSDTGPGMTAEEVNKLFDKYTRFNYGASQTTEGTGLGMSITQNLVHLMNGEIFVESEPGKGTTVTVHLPQTRVGSGVLGKEMAENLQRFRVSSKSQMKRVQISREPMPYGNVMIVDDVETNIYVAKGLMTPYSLKIDSVDSGFAVIEKIKNGNVYDIIFMDHMMPKMDGIEATKIIRGMGYKGSIVALTANAVAGQSDMFLTNGFDDFISKPIDIRQLNAVLNKLIRDKQPPEVIKAARRQAAENAEKNGQSTQEASEPSLDPQFAKIFVRDASKALATLDNLFIKREFDNEDNCQMYVINVHGMKSALANVGKPELSAVALKLEHAGREKNFEVILSETPAFLDSLRSLIEELTPKKDNESSGTISEDKEYLHEKLKEIKTACEDFNKKAAKAVVTELAGKTWTDTTQSLLDAISEHLLHSDFDEVVTLISKFPEV